MGVKCDIHNCDHNTGFTSTCMYGITESLIEHAKSGKPMCETLRAKVLALLDEEKK